MPVKRRAPKQRREMVPAWAERLLAGEKPDRDGDGWPEFIGWKFFADQVPGLPEATSPEGRMLLKEPAACR